MITHDLIVFTVIINISKICNQLVSIMIAHYYLVISHKPMDHLKSCSLDKGVSVHIDL